METNKKTIYEAPSLQAVEMAQEGVICQSAVLDDYTTERWITPASFDRDGIAWFELIKTKSMAAACHTVVIYQGNVCIGEAVYGNGTLPEELR